MAPKEKMMEGKRPSQKEGAGPARFKISTGLKRVIGRELITDREVAIFELVKNSFDAQAENVTLYFDEESIVIIDDGDGMTHEDIFNKWLFVAYSSKREEKHDYRDGIPSRHLAGSKGVGRFSSDRLGRVLKLQSKPKNASSEPVHQIIVDWGNFERGDRNEFTDIDVDYAQIEKFDMPDGVPMADHGTMLRITEINEDEKWDAERLRKLKRSLTKLINPFGSKIDRFNLRIVAPHCEDSDRKVVEKIEAKGEDISASNAEVINGPVENFIFEALEEKTTFVDVKLTEDGKFFVSSLTDRGEVVYKIKEENKFTLLKDSNFHCRLYYLNLSAKITFKRRMGIDSVGFGNVFLFRNGFRVYPVGETNDDWWGLSRRKQQGYARFLGTREVMGRVDVSGDEKDFQEASSRNQALLETPASKALKDCFMDACLKRLEAYVVPVSWPDKGESNTSDLSRLLTDEGRLRVSNAVAKLTGNKEIKLLGYSKRLIQVINERSEKFEESLANLRAIAGRAKDKGLMDSVDHAERRFEELKQAEQKAQKSIEVEQVAREEAEKRASKALDAKQEVEVQYQEQVERNLFLTAVTSLDYDTVINLHHQIILYAGSAGELFKNGLAKINDKKTVGVDDIAALFEQAIFLNNKIVATARFATKANFKLDSGFIEEDVASFVEQYIEEFGQAYLSHRIRIEVNNNAEGFVRRFKPIEFSILIENLISNAIKQDAGKIVFEISQPSKKELQIAVSDNGPGLNPKIKDTDDIFERGYSQTGGTGLGLYHVRQVLAGMGGGITVNSEMKSGVQFIIRFSL